MAVLVATGSEAASATTGLRWWTGFAALIPVAALVAIIAVLAVKAFPAIKYNGAGFLSRTRGNQATLMPTRSRPTGYCTPSASATGPGP